MPPSLQRDVMGLHLDWRVGINEEQADNNTWLPFSVYGKHGCDDALGIIQKLSLEIEAFGFSLAKSGCPPPPTPRIGETWVSPTKFFKPIKLGFMGLFKLFYLFVCM